MSEFGYTWPWTHGHLIAAILLAALAWIAGRLVSRWVAAILAAAAVWAFVGFLTVQFVFGFNRPLQLPTANFLAGGSGRVLDVGCGSGRATLMVGLARPGTHLVALDNFSAQYIRDNGEDLLRRNLRAAGLESRVEIVRADMREIPARDQEFDGVVENFCS